MKCGFGFMKWTLHIQRPTAACFCLLLKNYIHLHTQEISPALEIDRKKRKSAQWAPTRVHMHIRTSHWGSVVPKECNGSSGSSSGLGSKSVRQGQKAFSPWGSVPYSVGLGPQPRSSSFNVPCGPGPGPPSSVGLALLVVSSDRPSVGGFVRGRYYCFGAAALLPIEVVFEVGVFPSCHSVSEARPEHNENLEQRAAVAMIDCHGNDR